MSALRILLLEDDPLDAELVLARLAAEGVEHETVRAQDRAEYVAALDAQCPDLILSDYSLPAFDGAEALAIALERCPDVPFIFVSGALGEDLAIETLRRGATDYVLKHRLERLAPAIARAVAESAERAARREAEIALRDSEARFRFVAESIPQIVWTAGPDGVVDYVNPRWAEYTGLVDERAPSPSLHDRIHPDDRAAAADGWARAMEERGRFEVELRLASAAGEYRWFLARATPMLDDDGNVAKWFGTSTDIDDRRRLDAERAAVLERERAAREQAEQARAQAEDANREKDEFLAMVSHELRTPLNSMLGWIRLLRSGKLAADAYERGLETIERNVKSQVGLIEDLLDVSRIITGKLRFELHPVELPPIVETAVETVRPAADAKSIGLFVALDPSAGPVLGDPERLQQVFWNLLSNAVKFTPKGGRIDVTLARVDSSACVTVTDSGRGIDLDFLPYVFERFRQASSGDARTHGGLGLGLAIVRYVVEMHGGTVSAASDGPGTGAAFSVSLPVIPVHERRGGAGAPAADEAVDCPPTLDGVRILVVDDEPDSRDVVAFVLRRCQAEVLTVGSAAEALETLDRWTPDVLVSDIGMPEMDGYALIRAVRESAEHGDLLAVALTAYGRAEDRVKVLGAGFQMHVVKPVEPTELVMVVDGLLNIRRRREGR